MDAEKLEKQERVKKFLDGLTTEQALFVSENIEDLYLLADCREEMEGEKPKEKSVFAICMEIYNNFIVEKIGVKAKIDGTQGSALKKIIAYLKTIDKIKTDEDVITAFEFVLVNYDAWDNFYKQQTKLNQINSNFQNILNNIRNGVKKTNKSDREKRVDAVDELQRRAIEILEGNKE